MEKQEFEEKVAAFIAERQLIVAGSRVLVTVSGGADSVALMLVLKALGMKCEALHCNFHLRGEESMRDERFVRDLCLRLGVPSRVRDFDIPARVAATGESLEMACRELRYEWFEAERAATGIGYIAVAHHQDDNIETFFINALRGSGISGLAAIKPRNGFIVRPLLCVSRADIEQYLLSCGQPFVVDSTNRQSEYGRNKLRNIIIPALREQFPGCEAGLLRTLQNMADCNELYGSAVAELKHQLVDLYGGVAIVNMKELCRRSRGAATLLYEIVRDYGFNSEQAQEMWQVAKSRGEKSGKRFASSRYNAVFNRDAIEIVACRTKRNTPIPITIADGEEITVPVRLCTRVLPIVPPAPIRDMGIDGKRTVCFNISILDSSRHVELRHWRNGDRFHPYGMKGSKLVSDLFTDEKLGDAAKHRVWIMTVDDEIVWVLGLRAANKFPVNPEDRELVKISLLP